MRVDLDAVAPPTSSSLQTWRILHPIQKWHDLASEERPDRIHAFSLRSSGQNSPFAVFRKAYWEEEAQTAELYLWSSERSPSVLKQSVSLAHGLQIQDLTILAYGEVADIL